MRDNALTFDRIKEQYATGVLDADVLDPVPYHLDWALMSRPGKKNIQLQYFKDYRTNVELYPQFQSYFRKSQVPLLAMWGIHDVIFIPPGAEAFKRDRPNAKVELLDGGHFSKPTEEKLLRKSSTSCRRMALKGMVKIVDGGAISFSL